MAPERVGRRRDKRPPKVRLLHQRWGREVQRARIRAGFTQAQLAERARVGQNTISRIETGVMAPGDGLKFRLAAALDRNVDELFSFPDLAPGSAA